MWFPEPVTGPDGAPSYALLHRPMWDLGWIVPGEGTFLPAGVEDDRPGIWISYVPVAEVEADVRNLVRLRDHRLVAMSEYAWEALKIGAGPPPIRVDEGWLLIHHGVTGELDRRYRPAAERPLRRRARCCSTRTTRRRCWRARAEPLLSPETPEEVSGTVPNVVFPTAIESVDGVLYVFYGMGDRSIGVARLERQ